MRRSRGYAPLPVALPVTRPARAGRRRRPEEHLLPGRGRLRLDVGARRRHGRPGHPDTPSSAPPTHLGALTGVRPELVVADRHPGYRSAAWAARQRRTACRCARSSTTTPTSRRRWPRTGCDGSERVIGFAFDGTGYGDDGAVWGGEVLLADYDGYERAAHLRYVAGCPAGTRACATRAGWRCRTCTRPAWPGTRRCRASRRARRPSVGVLARQLETGCGCVPTSSMGRLFDAVSSIAGVCHRTAYEAQAAMRFEGCARSRDRRLSAPATGSRSSTTPLVADPRPVIAAAAAGRARRRRGRDRGGAVPPGGGRSGRRAGRDCCAHAPGSARWPCPAGCSSTSCSPPCAPTGCAGRLPGARHRTVPPSDAGLALGQVVIAARTFDE